VPDSRNLPTEFTEARFPFRVESLSLAVDSGGAGQYRGGLGYEKQIRMLKDGHFMSIADRSILACWGVRGGKAGKPFQVTIDPGGPREREVDALADAEPVIAGEVIRIRTTGGGGWGNPLERDPALGVRDVVWRKVSTGAALADYGVVLTGSLGDDSLSFDPDATASERASRAAPTEVFFDRGPGYAELSGGAGHADVDVL
jgi:N-methylhydantoinase B